jgi:hypothetical protein
MRVILVEQVHACILQQHDGLAVLDGAALDCLDRIFDRKLDHLDIFTLCPIASTMRHLAASLILGDEEVELLSDGAWTHEGFKDFPNMIDAVTGLLFSLNLDPVLWSRLIQKSGRCLDQQS